MNIKNPESSGNLLLSQEVDNLLSYVAIKANIISRQITDKPVCKVLFPTSYLHVDFNRIVDFIFATALKVRGVEIIPILCNGFHNDQCSVWPGLFSENFATKCDKFCKKPGSILWEGILQYEPLLLTDFEIPEDRAEGEKIADEISIHNYKEFEFNGFELGRQVGIEVRNSNNLARMLDNDICRSELRIHTINAVRMILAYERVFDLIEPNRVVGSWHDHFQWSTLFHVANKRGVHYYSHTMLEQKGCLYFGRDNYEACEVHGAWESFKDSDVGTLIWEKFDRSLGIRADGKATCFSFYPKRNPENVSQLRKLLDPNKPVAFFPANTPWDDAVRNHCHIAEDIFDMVHKVVSYFEERPKYQLIIKAHPYEQEFSSFDSLPHSLANIIKARWENIPPNVIFIDADSPISSFDVYELADVGMVHSTRSGCEMAMYGVPTILTAEAHYRNKGFTIDIKNDGEFFEVIEEILEHGESELVIQNRTEIARKYWLLYNSHGYINLGMFEGGWHQPFQIKFSDVDHFMPGANDKLDYICDCIISNRSVFGDNRWPPISI